jgi:hypothetical protein
MMKKKRGEHSFGDAIGVARTLRLRALTEGNLPLMKALQSRLAGESDGTTLRPLAALRPDEWIDLVYTYGTPDGITITPDAYADALSTRVEHQYPTAALAAHFTAGRRLAQQPMLKDVPRFLGDNPAFDIVTANLNAISEQAALGCTAEPQQLVTGLRTLQCMQSIGATWDETATLLENDIYSPLQLLAAGPTQLTALLKGQIAPERVKAIYHRTKELRKATLDK